MRQTDPKSKSTSSSETGFRRITDHERWFYLVALVIVSTAGAAGTLLTRAEAIDFTPDFGGAATVFCATVLLFCAGLYVTQRLISRQVHAEARLLHQTNQAQLAEISAALRQHLSQKTSQHGP